MFQQLYVIDWGKLDRDCNKLITFYLGFNFVAKYFKAIYLCKLKFDLLTIIVLMLRKF